MVTVVATKGSAPREAGARLIVIPDGTFTGTIGGGTLEWRAIALAQATLGAAALASSRGTPLRPRPRHGPMLRRPGRPAVRSSSMPADRSPVAELARARRPGRSRPAAGSRPTEESSGRLSTTASPRRHGVACAAASSSEGFGDDRRPLILFGAGHVGRALVLALAPLPFAVTWIDPRPDAFPGLPAGQRVAAPARTIPTDAFAEAAAGSFVLVMTHSHQLDLAVVHARARRRALSLCRTDRLGQQAGPLRAAAWPRPASRGSVSPRWSARSASPA